MGLRLSLKTREMYLFFPKGNRRLTVEEEKCWSDGKKLIRLVFDGATNYTDYENEQIALYRQFIEQELLRVENTGPSSEKAEIYNKWKEQNDYLTYLAKSPDNYLLRFLHAKHFNFKETMEQHFDNLRLRGEIHKYRLTPPAEEFLNRGGVYCFGRDKSFRPLFFVNVKKANFDETPMDVLETACLNFADYVIDRLLIPGQVENWVNHIDLKDVSMFNPPISKIKGFIGFLQRIARARAFRIYVLNAPWLVSGAWAIVKGFLDKSTADKVNIVSSNVHPKMKEHINLDNLEMKYGGRVPNLTEGFW